MRRPRASAPRHRASIPKSLGPRLFGCATVWCMRTSTWISTKSGTPSPKTYLPSSQPLRTSSASRNREAGYRSIDPDLPRAAPLPSPPVWRLCSQPDHRPWEPVRRGISACSLRFTPDSGKSFNSVEVQVRHSHGAGIFWAPGCATKVHIRCLAKITSLRRNRHLYGKASFQDVRAILTGPQTLRSYTDPYAQ